MKRLLPLLLLLVLAGCAGRKMPSGSDSSIVGPEEADFTAEARRWADSVVSGLPLEAQIAQMMLPGIYALGDEANLQKISDYAALGVGGVVLLKGDCKGASEIAEAISDSSAIPPFVAIDAEWGLGMRLSDAPVMPRNNTIGGVCTDQIMFDYGYEIARESRCLGINMVLGPVLDVASGGVIGFRSLGGHPRRVAELGVAYARGLEDGNVLSVSKHFPGHGSAASDSHKSLPVLESSLARLDSVDLLPFREYIAAGLSAIMVGHLSVAALDPQRRSAALSPIVISDLLRGDMGFRGLVITDALNMDGAVGAEDSDVAAVLAGADMIIAPRDTRKAVADIADAVRQGKIPAERVKDACRRILFFKYRFRTAKDDTCGGDVNSEAAVRLRNKLLRGE